MREEITRLKPAMVLALGGTALHALTGLRGITEWRGTIHANTLIPGLRVVGTFHPSYIMRLPDKSAKKERDGEDVAKYTYGTARLTTVFDTKRAAREAKGGQGVAPARRLLTAPSFEQVVEFLATASSQARVSFDVETRGKWVDCISFAYSPHLAISIPRGPEYWGSRSGELDERLKEFLWTHEGLVAQNGAFDISILLGNELPVRVLHMDTMIAHHFLYPELPHNLAYLTSIYTKEPWYKWRLKTQKDLQNRWEYNALDAAVTMEVSAILDQELREFKVEEEFYGYVMPLFHTTLKMGLRGTKVDTERKTRLQTALSFLIERKKKVMYATLGREININSPKQLQQYLYIDLKLPKQFKRDKTGNFKVTTDEEAIKTLAKLPGQTKLVSILDVRNVEKKKSTYADVTLSFDGRLRTAYSVIGTETGRLSSKQDIFGQGWNSQNPPKWFRKIIKPERGEILVEADLKFAEALLIAWFAKDEETIRNVRAGIDIYKWHAARMLGVAPEAIDKDTRDMFKPVVLGCGYGLGSKHLWELMSFKEVVHKDGREEDIPTSITLEQSKQMRLQFFKSCPAIGEYQTWVQYQLTQTRTLITPFNRRRLFLGRLGDEIFRKGYAFLPQSTCVEYMNRAMLRVDLRLPKEWGRLILQVHDAMVLSVKPERLLEVVQLMVEELALPVSINSVPLVIPTEIKMSERSWGHMKNVGVFNYFGKENNFEKVGY
jgi:DNA polymerase I-like protein with 3'-5' exonuclease and polymerase domains